MAGKKAAPVASDPVSMYAAEALAGRVPAAKAQLLSCERHVRDMRRQDTAAFPFVFDGVEAAKRIRFFDNVSHSKGQWAGLPLTLAPWQQFGVGSLFGWKRTSDGLRRFSSAYSQTPRKNGKSTLAAGIALQLAFFDAEDGAEVYCLATKKDQARIVFGDARAMVLRSPKLKTRIKVMTSNLHVEATRSKLEPLGADEDSTDGLNTHGAITDELHAHKTRGLLDVIDTSMGARRQPMHYKITTPGFDRESICYETYDYARAILEGHAEDETVFVFIADPDESDDWREPKGWAKANLGLGRIGQWLWDGGSIEECQARLTAERARLVDRFAGDVRAADREMAAWIGGSVQFDDLIRSARQAEVSAAAQNTFRRLRLGQWTEQSVRAIDMTLWDACKGTVDWRDMPEALRGRSGFLGIDLASTQDICAAVAVVGDDDAGYDLVPWLWMPRGRVASRKEASRVQKFIDDGALLATEGDIVDYREIRRVIVDEIAGLIDVREIGFDPWNARQITTELKDEDGLVCTEIRQGTRTLSEPTKKLLNLIAAGKIRHGGHPVLRWMATNFAVKQDPQGNLMPDREASADKIDGLAATVDALACIVASPSAAALTEASRDFEERGLFL